MNGVEILYTSGTMSTINTIMCILSGSLIVIISIYALIKCPKIKTLNKLKTVVPVVIITFLVLILGFYLILSGITQRTLYRVKVDDKVYFNDFMERYDIISEENGIWVVQDKKKR